LHWIACGVPAWVPSGSRRNADALMMIYYKKAGKNIQKKK
jgi:hypothetical protein